MVRDRSVRGGGRMAEAACWALGQFGESELGDRRLSKES